ncbi:65-kDa microtubule-associated protein 9 isoform X2 [Amborella trichopoda]|uniref:65-kDa microtubule-associated protein 9 isoform X2 n=1 Tax=Amborella trichopoda TaxID=13333 RepID=UPI0009BDAD50|nr:65-kDa microtubule-associated protein 9 isoform X2 [Amborella trichopoda]|eukprot:XP_006851756.2 65-kDa microtubule-associated protein 9 isoform X2 [Amborella trichopoda]
MYPNTSHDQPKLCIYLQRDGLEQPEPPWASLFHELQMIWDEVGKPRNDREKTLGEIEQECLEVYRKKVDHENCFRAQLRQTTADAQAELASICAAMGERPTLQIQPEQKLGGLLEDLNCTLSQLDEMRMRKSNRVQKFMDIMAQIQMLSDEINDSVKCDHPMVSVDEKDLSLRKLDDCIRKLETLRKEKSDRVKLVLGYLSTLKSTCSVLGIDFLHTVREVYPSLNDSAGSTCINHDTIEKLGTLTDRLQKVKRQRMKKLQDYATTMLQLWNLLDTPIEEQQPFQDTTSNIAASEHEMIEPNSLSKDSIHQVESEVIRLEELKGSRMKELALKKQLDLEEIYQKSHMLAETDIESEFSVASIESGMVNPSALLDIMEDRIANAKEEALSRKEIIELVEKWHAARVEESWLEAYNKDEKRYNTGKGMHLTLKHAERARIIVSKLPGMVDSLIAKTSVWERERGKEFMYDGVPLITVMEEYRIMKQEKEQEQRRKKEQKRRQGQQTKEQEVLFGSKPSLVKPQSARDTPNKHRPNSTTPNGRLSLGVTSSNNPIPGGLQSPKATTVASTHGVTPRSEGRKLPKIDDISTSNQIYQCLAAQGNGSSTQLSRRPFSPRLKKPPDDFKRTDHTSPKDTASTKFPASKVSKQNNTSKEELRSPNLKSNTTSTNSASVVCIHMQTQKTVAPFQISSQMTTSQMQTQTASANLFSGTNMVASSPKVPHVEYSFEEIRAGFVLPDLHVSTV